MICNTGYCPSFHKELEVIICVNMVIFRLGGGLEAANIEGNIQTRAYVLKRKVIKGIYNIEKCNNNDLHNILIYLNQYLRLGLGGIVILVLDSQCCYLYRSLRIDCSIRVFNLSINLILQVPGFVLSSIAITDILASKEFLDMVKL